MNGQPAVLRSTLRRYAAKAFVAAAFLFLGVALWRQRWELVGFDWQVDPLRLLGSTLLLVVVLFGGVAIWAWTLRQFGLRRPFATLARIWFLSNLGRYIPGKVWQLVGVAELGREAQIPALLSLTSLAIYMGLVLLAAWLVGIFMLPATALGSLGSSLPLFRLLSPLLLLLLHPRVVNLAVSWSSRLTRRPLADWRGNWRTGVLLLGACLLLWIGFGAAFHLFVSSLTEVRITQFPSLTAIFALSFLAGYVVLIAPAGLGAKEAALAGLLSHTMPLSVAATLAIAARIWTMLAEVLPALLLLRKTESLPPAGKVVEP